MIPWLACRAFRSSLPRALVSICLRHAQPRGLSAPEAVLHCRSPAWVPVACLGSLHASYSTPAATAAAKTAPPAGATTASTSVPTTASATPQFKVGHVYEATVRAVKPEGLLLHVNGEFVVLPPSIVSHPANMHTDLTKVFAADERIKVLVTGRNPNNNQPWVSIKALEATPGQVLTDKAAVWAGAETMAEKWRAEGVEKNTSREQFFNTLKEGDRVEGTFVASKGRWRGFFLVNGEHKVVLRWSAAKCDGLRPGDKVKLVVSERRPNGFARFERVVEEDTQDA